MSCLMDTPVVSREKRIRDLFSPLQFKECRSLEDVRQRALELGIRDTYRSRFGGGVRPQFLEDMVGVFPRRDDGTCHSRAVWTALMAEVVGFEKVELVMCIPKDPNPGSKEWAYHTAIKIGSSVLDTYLNMSFKSESLWIDHLNRERPGQVKDCSIVQKGTLDAWAELYPHFGAPQGTPLYNFYIQQLFIKELIDLGVPRHKAMGLAINIALARNPHFVAQMCESLYPTEFGLERPPQPPTFLAQALRLGIAFLMLNLGAHLLLTFAKLTRDDD